MLQSPRILLVFNLLDSLIYLVFFRKGIYRKILGVKVFALDKKRIKTKVLEVVNIVHGKRTCCTMMYPKPG